MSMVLTDIASERGLLSCICQGGSFTYYDVSDIINEHVFTNESNKLIFLCLKHLIKTDDNSSIDVPSILSASLELGFSHVLSRKDESAHLAAIMDFPVNISNARKFATKIRKLEITRLLRSKLEDVQQNLLEIKGDETVTHILSVAEEPIFDFSTSLNDSNENPQLVGEGLKERLIEVAENPITQVGIPTGFEIWDQTIGGGLRNATVTVVAARPKCGKTVLGDNVGYHISSKYNIPILNLDTEMLRKDHEDRIIANLTSIPITTIETGEFGKYPNVKESVIKACEHLNTVPYYHKSISGKSLEEQLSIIRRWIARTVGLQTDGTAKQCVIIYDYLKLMNAQDINNNLTEYQLLGFMMTSLHNFAVKYNIPILLLVQLNRDGIQKQDSSTISGSDRILWLCDSLSLLKFKNDEERAEDGVKNGNRKLVTIASRHGPGLDDGNYINCEMLGQFARIKEKSTKFELEQIKENKNSGFVENKDNNKILFNNT